MMGPQDGRRTMELMSTSQGYAGLVIRSVPLPPPGQMIERFWKRLYLERQFPLLLPVVVLVAIQKSFIYQQASLCKTVQKIQETIAYHFSQQGSVVSVANDPAILTELWQRIAWFCVAQYSAEKNPANKAAEEAMAGAYCRSILLGDDSQEDSSMDLLRRFQEIAAKQQQANLVLQLMASISQSKKRGQRLNVFNPTFNFLLDTVTQQDVLQQLFELRKQICDLARIGTANIEVVSKRARQYKSKDMMIKYVTLKPIAELCAQKIAYEQEQLTMKQNLIHELIILVGNCRDGNNLSEIEQLLNYILQNWMLVHTEGESPSVGSWWTKQDWEPVVESFSSEPRRQSVAALLRLQEAPGECGDSDNGRLVHLSLVNIAGTMYRLIQDKVAVTQEDWYEDFWQKAIVEAAVEVSREKSTALFSFGLRYLKQCGFISEKLRVGSRSEIIYERALVWCGCD